MADFAPGAQPTVSSAYRPILSVFIVTIWLQSRGCYACRRPILSPLRNTPRLRSIIFKQIPIIWWKNRENLSSSFWDNWSQVKKNKKKEINASKIYSPLSNLPSELNKKSDSWNCLVPSVGACLPTSYGYHKCPKSRSDPVEFGPQTQYRLQWLALSRYLSICWASSYVITIMLRISEKFM